MHYPCLKDHCRPFSSTHRLGVAVCTPRTSLSASLPPFQVFATIQLSSGNFMMGNIWQRHMVGTTRVSLCTVVNKRKRPPPARANPRQAACGCHPTKHSCCQDRRVPVCHAPVSLGTRNTSSGGTRTQSGINRHVLAGVCFFCPQQYIHANPQSMASHYLKWFSLVTLVKSNRFFTLTF